MPNRCNAPPRWIRKLAPIGPPHHRFTVRREPLNAGGYTSAGEYFGNVRGQPLYRYDCDCGEHGGYVRGQGPRPRDWACAQVRLFHSTAAWPISKRATVTFARGPQVRY